MQHNEVFDTAVDFVNNTACSIFLTGKAGTGKTTFLKHIKEYTPKKCVVVAPTGVAAINAGGVTMHSFFQLPLGPYVPVNRKSVDQSVTDKHALFKNIRISTEKRELLQDLQLLIIDEVSMVRCDTLDAIDAILRHFRRKPHLVFGGVQVLFIGDLFQLPPVMPDAEWSLLREYYAGPFFFHSKAVEQRPPVYLELKKIYRQNEQTFIEILNRIRNNEVYQSDLETLNRRHHAEKIAAKKYITLTSHNHKADRINREELSRLTGKLHEFTGVIEGDFPEKALPTEMTLQLKEGAQVMFIRNDKSEERRYFNGKIVTVKKIDESGIRVISDDAGDELLLEKETWSNIRYSYNPADEKIDEEKLGAFSQYPIRLAWAITIHKSQGLTFDHAIIDAGESFAPGQVYVALSRCVALEGMVLHSRIEARSIATHAEVLSFVRNEIGESELSKVLQQEKHVFLNTLLLETFDLQHLMESIANHLDFIHGKRLPDIESAFGVSKGMLNKAEELQQVALKFKLQLEALLKENNLERLKDRVSRAIDYFIKGLTEELLSPLDKHIESVEGKKKVKKYLKRVGAVRLAIVKKIHSIQEARLGEISLNTSKSRILIDDHKKLFKPKKQKAEKGSSFQETLRLFNQGNSIAEIALKRQLASSTIEGHMAILVKSGDVDIHRLVDEHTINEIVTAIRESQPASLTQIKQRLGEDYSFGQIRTVMSYLDFMNKESTP
jgi:hypothetical protein